MTNKEIDQLYYWFTTRTAVRSVPYFFLFLFSYAFDRSTRGTKEEERADRLGEGAKFEGAGVGHSGEGG